MNKLILCCVLSVAFCFGDGAALYKKGAALFKTDPVQALELFEQAAEAGNISAMVGAGHCYETGVGVAIDYAKAIGWYQLAVEYKSIKGCEGLARIYASCPDPKFHDGEKAVKFSGAVVRKKPRDYSALALLAKAQARNMQFAKAIKTIEQAMPNADDEYQLELQQLLEQFETGVPEPAVASRVWMMKACDTEASFWAIQKLAREAANPHGESYDPQFSMAICKKADHLKIPELYLIKGFLYLDNGELDEAFDSFEMVSQLNYRELSGWKVECAVYSRSYLKKPAAEVFYKAETSKKERKTVSSSAPVIRNTVPKHEQRNSGVKIQRCNAQDCEQASCGDCTITMRVEKVVPPAHADTLYFLYKIAAVKGSKQASERLAKMDETIFAYRGILQSTSQRSREETAKLLVLEARKHQKTDVIPRNPLVAADLYKKAFSYYPSADIACELGELYLNRTCGLDAKQGIEWLVTADSMGCDRATRRLIKEYAFYNRAC